jgi:hypothetical protein
VHAVSLAPNARKSTIKVEFLREYEEEFQKALARESEAQGDCLMKKPKVENLVTLHL